MHLARIIFGALGLGLATTIVLFVLLLIVLGGDRASQIIFGISPAIFVVLFGAAWFPFVRRRMK